MSSLSRLKDASLAFRLSFAVMGVVTLVMAVFFYAFGASLEKLSVEKASSEAQSKVSAVLTQLEAFHRDSVQRATTFGEIFKTSLGAGAALDSAVIEVNGKAAPTLRIGGQVMNRNTAVPDNFTQTTAAVATVFARSGDDFIRVTTSVKNEKGERAMGTVLDRAHPAYAQIVAGKSFVGYAKLFGKEYITVYAPLMDAAGKVIGISFVGLDISAYVKEFKESVAKLGFGKTGYFYILDAREGAAQGSVVHHPDAAVKNMASFKSSAGVEYVKDMLSKDAGVLTYQSAEEGDVSRQRTAVFIKFPAWTWVFVGTAYSDEFNSEVNHTLKLFAVAGLLVIGGLAAVLVVLIRRMVIRPLAQAMTATAALASGDLTVQVEAGVSGEMGQVLISLNEVGQGLSKVVAQVREGSDAVAQAAVEISQGNNELSARTEAQASALEETSVAMTGFAQSVKRNANIAVQANALAKEAAIAATDGGVVVAEVVTTMQGIKAASQSIAEIISVIDGIAFQTNILALNAAVEAARAGEQGRGFAVVASEVRTLAGRSAEAAKEIKVLVSENFRRVDEGTELVGRAGVAVTGIVSGVQKVAGMISDISTSSQEQSVAVEQVSQAISQLDQTTQQNAALVEEMAAAAQSMSQQAVSLVDAAAAFKI